MSSTTEQPSVEAGGSALGPLVVTDQELSLLEQAHHRLLRGCGPDDPALEVGEAAGGAREAFLSLVARGLLDGDGELSERDDLAVLVATVLDVRLAADLVLAVERVVAAQDITGEDLAAEDVAVEDAGVAEAAAATPERSRDWSTDPEVRRGTRLVHLVGSGACVEDLLPDGSHHLYLLLDRDDVVPWVTAVTVPPAAAAGTGPPLAVHPDRPEEIPAMLGHPSALAELSVFASGEEALEAARDRNASPAHHLLALGPSGCWVTDVDPGRSLPEEVHFRPVRPAWVGEWVRAVLDEGLDAGRAVGAGSVTERARDEETERAPDEEPERAPDEEPAAGRRGVGGEQGTMCG